MKMMVIVMAGMLLMLTGLGQAQSKKVVTLTWNASQSQGVTGYKVYRGTATGGPYSLITPTVVAGLTCDDPNTVRGNTYFYVATSVDGTGDESGLSNESKAVVPPPLQPAQGLSNTVH